MELIETRDHVDIGRARRPKIARARLIEGDCRDVLPTLEAGKVHACICSPPYYRLRDYQLGEGQLGLEPCHDCQGWATGGKCGACYVCRLVDVFAAVKRVLRDDGTLWIVIADSYASSTKGSGGKSLKQVSNTGSFYACRRLDIGLPSKSLLGIPWRLALALQADGWILRSSIIWAKPNPMPESVKSRCTRSHEYVLMLAKSPRYFFDMEAIKETCSSATFRKVAATPKLLELSGRANADGLRSSTLGMANDGTRHRRDVFTIATQPLKNAHYAAFPEALVEPMILAATSEAGVCSACGKPWQRITQRTETPDPSYNGSRFDTGKTAERQDNRMSKGERYLYQDIGFQAACACGANPTPATVIDPLAGSGTVGLVADRLGRNSVMIEANPDYINIARARMATAKG